MFQRFDLSKLFNAKMGCALFLAGSLSACASYEAIQPNGAVVKGLKTPVFSTTQVKGMDAPTVHSNQIVMLKASENEQVSCLGDEAAELAEGKLGQRLNARAELQLAQARINGKTSTLKLCQ